MNERLRNAMVTHHVDINKLVEVTGVDPKTVQRWMFGRTPHARHRWAIAKCLNESEEFLWSEATNTSLTGTPKTAEVIAAYARRSDVPISLWWDLFTKAENQIDLLGFAMLFLPEQHPDLIELLREKSQAGCKIRISTVDPEDKHVQERDEEEGLGGTLAARIRSTLFHFEKLVGECNIAIAVHHTPLYNSVFRFDSEMFVTPHLYGLHGSQAPLFHLRNLGRHGVFANFADHFDTVWANTNPLATIPKAISVRAKANLV